jgi:hypothetical protein
MSNVEEVLGKRRRCNRGARGSPPQRLLFESYFKHFKQSIPLLPALLPEVWLHWDPKTVRERGADALLRFRMDFLMLLPNNVRVVIEVDGKHHYADAHGVANSVAYAAMVAADREPTGWPKVDRQLGELQLRLREAANEEQFQSIGHLCRETLISVAQIVYDSQQHPSLDGIEPSKTDAKRMLDAFVSVELAGSENAAIRKAAKAAFDLSNDLQHNRTATFCARYLGQTLARQQGHG